MRAGVNHGLASIAFAAVAITATAAASDPQLQESLGQWVPSLAITSGVTLQQHTGNQISRRFDGGTNTTSVLRPDQNGEDRAVSPFVGGAFELMTPALRLPGSPRFFAAGEVLPTFATERLIVNQGQPSRISGPEANSVLAVEETDRFYLIKTTTGQPDTVTGPRPPRREFFADEARGQGSRMVAQVEKLAFGAKAGVAFAFSAFGRQMRVKPSVGWIEYKVATKGYLVHPTCLPRCTNTYDGPGDTTPNPGFLRESILRARDSGTFDGVGPGLDLEMDTGRFGPIGTALFIGIHSYYIPGDRDIDFGASRTYNDFIAQQSPAGPETESVNWHFRVNPWIHRGAVGVRFQWLGSGE